MSHKRADDGGLFDDYVFASRHDLLDDRLGRVAERLMALDETDGEVATVIRGRAHRERVRQALGKGAPFRVPRLASSGVFIGTDHRGGRVFIPESAVQTHMLSVGGTGAGKSNLLKLQLLQLAGRGRGLLMTDLHKQDLRHLRPLLGRVGVDLVVARLGDLRLNPLQADDRDLHTHAAMAVGWLVRSLDLPPRARTILAQHLHALYAKWGNAAGDRERWPCLFDLFESIRADKGANAASKDAILDRLGALLLALGPKTVGYRLAWRPTDLARHTIDLELGGASEAAKSVIALHLLFSNFYSRVQSGRVNSDLDLIVVLDDAQKFLAGAGLEGGELAPISELLGLVRGMGIGVIALTQSMDGLGPGLVANLSGRFMGRLGTHRDLQQLGTDMGMTAEQVAWCRLNLGAGRFAVSLADGAWRAPFIVDVPHMKVPAAVDDQEAQRSLAALAHLPCIPAPEYERWTPFPVTAVKEATTGAHAAPEPPSPKAESGTEGLDDAERRFLRAVVDNPGVPSSAMAKLAGLSAKRAIAVREDLIARGFLRAHQVATGGRGRLAIVLEPLERALRAVGGPASRQEGRL